MHYTISLVVLFYAISAVIDAMLGMTTVDSLRSYIFRAASVAAVLAIYVHVAYRRKIVGYLSFILISLVLSIVTLAFESLNSVTTLSLGIKIASVVLSLKPEMIELEIITEDEEKEQI